MEKIIAFFLLILFFPFLMLLWLVMNLFFGGKFIFKQKRIGKNFVSFYIYKIRTMLPEADNLKSKYSHLNEAEGPVFKIYNDPRLTYIGKFLSRTGLDEILQLINIIKGEMSFIGPRPLPVEEAKKIPKKYQARFSVNPGITSLWIVRGAHALTFDQWMKSDLEYVRKKSFRVDLSIAVQTILLILTLTKRELVKFIK